MSIKIPHELDELLREIERSNWPKTTKLRLEAVGFRPQNDEVNQLREAERDKLEACAVEIFDWCDQLVNNSTTARIWSVIGIKARLLIYWGKYFNGQPLPASDVSGQAHLRVGRVPGINGRGQATPILWYEERYKWHPPTSYEIRDPKMLVDAVHPRFLKKLHERLSGPQPWKWVIQDLKNRRPPKK